MMNGYNLLQVLLGLELHHQQNYILPSPTYFSWCFVLFQMQALVILSLTFALASANALCSSKVLILFSCLVLLLRLLSCCLASVSAPGIVLY